MENKIELINISKKYGNNEAVKDVTLTFESGKIIGLLGSNGSGKSTIIKLVNGLITPTKGKILINGQPPSIESKKIISYLPEHTYLNDWMKVKDIIKFFQEFYDDFSSETAFQMLTDLSIDKNARLKTLSKGTKEKVQLILVMSRKAVFYILDEPIGGVDPAARDYILNTILKNYNEESTIIISTHLIQDVEQILDTIIFVNNGEIILQDEVDKIREEKGLSVDGLFREVFKC